MGALQGLGCVIGEYVGDGQGELETDRVAQAVFGDVEVDLGLVNDLPLEQHEEHTENEQPLLVLYDCETTGLNIYSDHIIEIAAEVMHCPVSLPNLSFSSLVKTSRRIPIPGMN